MKMKLKYIQIMMRKVIISKKAKKPKKEKEKLKRKMTKKTCLIQ